MGLCTAARQLPPMGCLTHWLGVLAVGRGCAVGRGIVTLVQLGSAVSPILQQKGHIHKSTRFQGWWVPGDLSGFSLKRIVQGGARCK